MPRVSRRIRETSIKREAEQPPENRSRAPKRRGIGISNLPNKHNPYGTKDYDDFLASKGSFLYDNEHGISASSQRDIEFLLAQQPKFPEKQRMPMMRCQMGLGDLDAADRENAHSMTLTLREVVDLFRIAKLEKHLVRRVLGFSISFDHRSVRIYAHYPVIDSASTNYYRRTIRSCDFTEFDGRDRWTAYKFVRSVYAFWAPRHLALLSEAIDELPMESLQRVFRRQPMPSVEN
ncbi:hypothetical protein AJ79_01864 [Helicocarpus griseus UAMH5409]|uniref:DUF7924 domain-containing protein n=1 Tax=Helicocarpus griseus UAMH5409 TaxID=1447875 RepID=A0A2B7Y626_9EURO|nr:hypothetical protein AJ79_01864 [Helicocarpus griseus UAMH5409]